jgi:5-methylcytosine-specific restriction endonuclease McrA
MRGYREKNKDRILSYQRDYTSKRYKQRREHAIERLGGTCNNCGTSSNLQFDHISPAVKNREVTTLLLGRIEKLMSELKYCQLLCESCHMKKTIVDNGKSELKHATNSMYTKGCRCSECQKAHTLYQNNYNKSRRMV